MCAAPREFVDKQRPVMKDWYELIERAESLGMEGIKAEAKELIKKDPDFLDPYTLLFEIMQDEGDFDGAEEMLDEAYTRAVRLITDKEGNWPDVLEWGYLENRHIIRAIVNKGLWLWDNGQNQEALGIFRNLLRANLNDNIGARFYILGIRMDMTFEEFQDQFDKGGYYDREIIEWFEANMDKFPDEFSF